MPCEERVRKGETSQLGPPKWEVTRVKPSRLALEITTVMGERGRGSSKVTNAWALGRAEACMVAIHQTLATHSVVHGPAVEALPGSLTEMQNIGLPQAY